MTASIGLFRPGSPDSIATVACGPGVPPVTGDVNGDGVIDVADLVDVIGQWGDCPPPPTGCPADLDGSGQVDVTDLLLVITNWS